MFNVIHVIGIWIAVFLTLMVFSFLYKENPFFRLAEYLIVGLSTGYGVVAGLRLFINQSLNPILLGSYDFVIPLALGLMFYLQFSKKYGYLYRLPLSLAIGYGLGVTVWSVTQAYFVAQIKAAVVPINFGDPATALNQLILVGGTVLSLAYFVTSRRRTGMWGKVVKVGKSVVLIALGAVFGSTVLGRMALLIQRTQFLTGDPTFPWQALQLGNSSEGRFAPVGIIFFVIAFVYYLNRTHRDTQNEAKHRSL